MQKIIHTENLTKKYGDFLATSDLNLSIDKGEIYGFLGLNGTGKTTTIRMLLGMISPSKGQVLINQTPITNNNRAIWENVGYMVETPHAYPTLTVKENLQLIYKLRKLTNKKSINEIIDKLKLNAFINRKEKHLSLGNKQRLGLAKALIHQPEILILDEPTNGLDPAGIHDIREMLIDLAQNHGVTIFISSHILGEISHIATRIGIIHQGKLIQEINTNELESLCNKRLVIESTEIQASHKLLIQNGFDKIAIENNQIVLSNEEALQTPQTIAKILVSSGLGLKKLIIEEENLESYFLRTIKESSTQSQIK